MWYNKFNTYNFSIMTVPQNFEKLWISYFDDYNKIIFEWLNVNTTLANFLEKHKRFPVIAVTWPAWVWKTTITNTISDFYWAKEYRELPELNPFLPLIWKTKDKVQDSLWFPNQSLFCAQDSGIITDWFINAQKSPIVFDFAITQTKAYWNLKLKWQEKINFNRTFDNLFYWEKWWFWWLPKPDLIIQIKATDESIIKRRENRWKYIDWMYVDEVWKMNEVYNSNFLENHYWNIIEVFDNSENIWKEELVIKVNHFLENLSK